MPVSVVCETTANVNAALRESLGGGAGGGSCASAAAASASALDDAKSSSSGGGGLNDDDVDSLQSKLVASAKRVLLSKIDYEEVSNYSQTVLDTLKSKYLVLKPNQGAANGASSAGTCNNNSNNNTNGNSNGANSSSAADTNGNALKQRSAANPNELPPPKRILYARDNIRIGWRNSQRKWQVGVGMMNVGNTCYLNSTLQALFHVPSLANWLVSDAQHMERCDAADAGCIICAMAKTLHASQSSQSAIRPYFIYSKLKAICKHLVMGRQEDAHEFLRYLVEAMEKAYLTRCRNFKELDQYSKETTPLNQILGGYLRSAVRCLACSHVSVTFQHFQDLLLDIRKADTVEEALEGYFARERLEDMGYKCEACKKKVSATKQFSLERAPIALCIQLKRFSMLGTKINKQITIKPRLDLSKFTSRKQPGGGGGGGGPTEPLTYKLVAMVTHLGASQHCGHYTAIGLTESGTYYNYDDSYVRPISVQNVCNTNAYIIFYELDAPRVAPSATQISGAAADAKENYQKLQQNGYGSSPQQQRIIGPQLPPVGLSGFATASSVLANVGSKLSVNRQSAIPTNTNGNNSNSSSNNNNSSSKIMIHFKNNNSNNTNGLKSSSATATSSSVQNGNHTYLQQHQHNGLLTGTGKFQESAHAKSSLAGPSNQGQTAAAANGNESSSSDHDDEDEVSSSTPSSKKSTAATSLPSMPKLGENNSNSSSSAQQLSNGKKHASSASTTTITPPLLPKSPLKSLVPYESESEWDEDETTTTAAPKVNGSGMVKPPLKRRSSSSSSEEENDSYNAPKKATTNGHGVVKAKKANGATALTNGNSSLSQSKAKQKTDAIDDIFNFNSNNGNNNKRNANSNNHNNNNNAPLKKQKPLFHVSSTSPTSDSEQDDDDEANNGNSHTSASFNRSHSTPPSPPVIKTKTGLWQVTSLQPANASSSEQATSPNKNHKNPFAAKSTPPAEVFSSKRSKSETKRTFAGNGYQRSASDGGGVVSELLKQSHRGYGAPVLSWTGDQTEIEREIDEESREQRQRDWEDEEDNEMDRGRQKKVKAHKEPQNRIPGYNPFQEQDNQRRWKHGGNGGAHHRFHGGNFRHQFQRNKFKFPRFNHKFQRTHQRNGGGGGGGAGGGGTSNGGYQRRDS